MRRIRIFLEYLAAFILILVLLFAIASVIVIKYYGDELKEYTMDLVNEKIDTKIYIEEMGISIFRRLPHTSVFFNDVTIWSGHGFARSDFQHTGVDTLFTAENVFLQFNLIDLARKKFTIKSMESRNGSLSIYIDKQGNSNYKVTGGSGSSSASGPLDIKGLDFKNFDIRFTNMAKNISASVMADDIQLEGNFASREYRLKGFLKGLIHVMTSDEIHYLSNQPVVANLSMFVKDNVYSISRGELELGDQLADIGGEFCISEGASDLQVRLTGKKIEITWLLDILKKNGVSFADKLNGRGKVDLASEVNGLISSTLTPHIQMSFSTRDATIQLEDFPYAVESLKITGSFHNGIQNSAASSNLDISSLSARLGGSEIFGSLAVQNFTLPRFTLNAGGTIDLSNLETILPSLPVSRLHGSAIPDLQMDGIITGIGSERPGISFYPKGQIEFSETGFRLNKERIEVDSLRGNLEISNEQWYISASGLLGDSDLAIKASSTNLLDYLMNDKSLYADISLKSRSFKLDELLNNLSGDEDTINDMTYPQDIGFRLDYDFEHIEKSDVCAENFRGIMQYAFPSLTIDSLHAETMNGEIDGMLGLYNLNKDEHLTVIKSRITQVKIEELFSSFNNFNQDFLTADNIKGRISGDVDFSALVNKEFRMGTSDIYLDSDIQVEDGELNDFEPIIEMSKFLRIDKMDHILFSTLENSIRIEDNLITIPEMDIQSNALNLSASGVHSFDKSYKYHLAIRLSEILFKKAQSSANREFEVALDEQDQRTVFLLVYDEGDGVLVDFDEQQALNKIKEDLRDERRELKVVLHEEFGFFEEDEDVIEHIEPEERPMFKFEFTDEDEADTIPAVQEKKRRWRQKKRENKKELDFVIEHDLYP
jgi:hypothetical protein